MKEISELKQLYRAYYEKSIQVRKKASVFAGAFGFGDDPRKHPCHEEFYDAAGEWVAAFLAENPDADQTLEAVEWILSEPLAHREDDTFWFLYAAHGHVRPLIGLLRPSDCARLCGWYDDNFVKRDRLPVQREVYKLLKTGSRKQK